MPMFGEARARFEQPKGGIFGPECHFRNKFGKDSAWERPFEHNEFQKFCTCSALLSKNDWHWANGVVGKWGRMDLTGSG